MLPIAKYGPECGVGRTGGIAYFEAGSQSGMLMPSQFS